MNTLQLLLVCLAGWLNRNPQSAFESLQEEVRVLKEQLGRRPRFNDNQRRVREVYKDSQKWTPNFGQ